ncbi:MAG: hypothetical protein A2655_00520 [Candidatus Yanofskybacteria bacterium RIFCSPHIGHO2_01_FULL_43_42]|uniref:DUF7282 domain-containing protein n=1 Tax=Candidatus Yanofskybacteria bacterium RIFCSPLOWO2_01_FULL_43_22 TaxID=1802695 RepID=A0A1F8GIK3_9BACT|nr:MAG: hypothetical protein A2655_00520 [Candidatus Yanofskybacteria bacterium RIFCSPHIGHO2_01_FULL_43_42]OGN13740.1 MAG: hypothetical protein A3D48_00270 [Candidatus Yanofskybacteria bacterium RIFCSPHIGHO2_02_FULL_43_17]OGN24259.1 MAG: hypothetical protein A3A13_03715 [Candidatus Yanofskybacteria bacterium RIFCSPLOWO2_01_FULL_43_22]
MNTKNILILGIIVAIGVGAVFLFLGKIDESDPAGSSAGLIVGENAIYVAEQLPSNTVLVAIVRLEKPGFAVIHEDINNAPGKMLGASSLIMSGETKDPLTIKLSRSTLDGETAYAMLHFDNGDGIFDATKDELVYDPIANEPVMMVIAISKDAIEEPDMLNL